MVVNVELYELSERTHVVVGSDGDPRAEDRAAGWPVFRDLLAKLCVSVSWPARVAGRAMAFAVPCARIKANPTELGTRHGRT
jgi:hypothetical protein